ncbi:MAG: MerR family transcriptional regulator [Syntrophotaleaceae bacterium]
MSLGKTWFTPEEAAAMFGVERALVLKWVEEGLVRCERQDGMVTQVNIDDLRLEVEAFLKQS